MPWNDIHCTLGSIYLGRVREVGSSRWLSENRAIHYWSLAVLGLYNLTLSFILYLKLPILEFNRANLCAVWNRVPPSPFPLSCCGRECNCNTSDLIFRNLELVHNVNFRTTDNSNLKPNWSNLFKKKKRRRKVKKSTIYIPS